MSGASLDFDAIPLAAGKNDRAADFRTAYVQRPTPLRKSVGLLAWQS